MTKIEWTDEVWNPVTGCTKVSPGCKNCYAERIAGRFWGERKFTDVICHEDRLDIPLCWRKPRRVFVNSMSDLFHPEVPYEFITQVFIKMLVTPKHTYQILTKRPERMYEYTEKILGGQLMAFARSDRFADSVLPNVWLGVSVEDQNTADERIPWLLKTPAAVRFVSYEPALGPVDFRFIRWAEIPVRKYDYETLGVPAPDKMWSCNNVLSSRPADQWNLEKVGLDWIIAGGESGPGARPAHPDWFRSVRDQCQEAGVPFFFKQWGEWYPTYPFDKNKLFANKWFEWNGGVCSWKVGKKAAGRLLDGREWNEYPERHP